MAKRSPTIPEGLHAELSRCRVNPGLLPEPVRTAVLAWALRPADQSPESG